MDHELDKKLFAELQDKAFSKSYKDIMQAIEELSFLDQLDILARVIFDTHKAAYRPDVLEDTLQILTGLVRLASADSE